LSVAKPHTAKKVPLPNLGSVKILRECLQLTKQVSTCTIRYQGFSWSQEIGIGQFFNSKSCPSICLRTFCESSLFWNIWGILIIKQEYNWYCSSTRQVAEDVLTNVAQACDGDGEGDDTLRRITSFSKPTNKMDSKSNHQGKNGAI